MGAVLGPAVDSIHNQALLSYDILPVSVDFGALGAAKTSLVVPLLLAFAYWLLGSALPPLSAALLKQPEGRGVFNLPFLPGLSPPLRALLAVASTCLIIKLSVSLSLPMLAAIALLQWAALDGTASSLALAALAALGGPVAELPLMWAGAWHYTSPDYWPLAPLGLGPESGSAWAGLSSITGPCYFAVTTDAIALGRWLGGGGGTGSGSSDGPVAGQR